MANFKSNIKTIEWTNNVSRMIDQTVVPYELKYVDIKTGQQMYDAIQTMIIRGAPAIGIAGARARFHVHKHSGIGGRTELFSERHQLCPASLPVARRL